MLSRRLSSFSLRFGSRCLRGLPSLVRPSLSCLEQKALRCSHSHMSTLGSINDSSTCDPFAMTKEDLGTLTDDIRKELYTPILPLHESSQYYFDGHGKSFRPVTVMLIARACNSLLEIHSTPEHHVSQRQRKVAMIAEMIHTASLMHDDVIDESYMRRGKPAINHVFSDKQTILAGDYILSKASIALARIGDCRVVELIAKIIGDLVEGELMQLVNKEAPEERFSHYIEKTFKKTASLLAYSSEAVAHLAGCSDNVQASAFNFGRNIGIAFQLVDDALDFTSTASTLGKPVAADLKYGLATAPVLYAAEKFPELNSVISRRFQEDGDVALTLNLINKSDSVDRTFTLAKEYTDQAIKDAETFSTSSVYPALLQLTKFVVVRDK